MISPAGSCCAYSLLDPFGDAPEKVMWLKERLEEYKKVRPFMSEDFYPLTQVSDRKDIWCAAQFHRPSLGDGIVQVFRREESPYEAAKFQLHAIDPSCAYLLTDTDTGVETTVSGATLISDGLPVYIPQKRASRIYFYQKA